MNRDLNLGAFLNLAQRCTFCTVLASFLTLKCQENMKMLLRAEISFHVILFYQIFIYVALLKAFQSLMGDFRMNFSLSAGKKNHSIYWGKKYSYCSLYKHISHCRPNNQHISLQKKSLDCLKQFNLVVIQEVRITPFSTGMAWCVHYFWNQR